MSAAGDLALGSLPFEVTDVGEEQGLPASQRLAELPGLTGVLPVERAQAPALAVHRVPLVLVIDLQMALAPRAGAA